MATLVNNAYGRLSLLGQAYFFAKKYVIKHGYSSEIEWQESRNLELLTKSDIIREAAWVILSAGLSYAVVQKKFPEISKVFFNWNKPYKIIEKKLIVRDFAA